MVRIISVCIFVFTLSITAAHGGQSRNLNGIVISPFSANYYSEEDGKDAGKGNDGTDTSIAAKHVFSESVTRPALNLTFPFHGIDSYNLYGVWEGTMYADEARTVRAHFDVSWSDVCFFVNEQLVEKWENESKIIEFALNKGENRLRIELHNHWHTTSFNVSFADYKKLDNGAAVKLFGGMDFSSTKVVYLGAYEAHGHTANNDGNELVVTLPRSSLPVFLFLNSFRAVNWVVSNPHKAPVSGVALRGNSPGSTVTLKEAVPVYELPSSSNSYKGSHNIQRYIGRYADYAFTEYSLNSIDVPDFFDSVENSSDESVPVTGFSESLVVRKLNKTLTQNRVVQEPSLDGSFVKGRWQGYMEVSQKVDKTFKIAYQNVQAELVVDGRSVWRGKKRGDDVYQHSFEPGRHEVMIMAYPDEESKSAHFKVSVSDNAKQLNYEALTNQLKKLGDFDSFYCGVQNSIVEEQTVDIVMNESKNPAVLFLTSYRRVMWDFKQTDTEKLLAVVTSAKNSSEYIKNLPAHIPVYHYFRLSNTIELIADRSTSNTFKKAALQIQALTGNLPAGFTGAKQAKEVTVPERVLDRKQYVRLGLADVSPEYNIFIEHPRKIDIVFNPEPTRYIDYSSTSNPRHSKRFEPRVQRASWAGPLGVVGDEIPFGKFKAYYFDIFNPGEPKFSGIVNDIWVKSKRARRIKGKYVYEYGIEPENFGAFWIGKIKLRKDSDMVIAIDSGNNQTRILIDGKEVKERKISLPKGVHTVEVEYVNDWHTYEFYFSITKDSKPLLAYERLKRQMREKMPQKMSWEEIKDKASELWRSI